MIEIRHLSSFESLCWCQEGHIGQGRERPLSECVLVGLFTPCYSRAMVKSLLSYYLPRNLLLV